MNVTDVTPLFNQQFYFVLNLAVGGTNSYFPDGSKGPYTKPWKNSSPNVSCLHKFISDILRDETKDKYLLTFKMTLYMLN
jgi:hypothetical protein